MKVFIKYDIEQNEKKKIYTSSKLDNQFHFRKYNNASYMWDRNNGSSYLKYENNKLIFEVYRTNGKLHRINGPAIIDYETDYTTYWIDNEKYENEFEYWLDVGNCRKEK